MSSQTQAGLLGLLPHSCTKRSDWPTSESQKVFSSRPSRLGGIQKRCWKALWLSVVRLTHVLSSPVRRSIQSVVQRPSPMLWQRVHSLASSLMRRRGIVQP